MARELSVVRRRSNLVDLTTKDQGGNPPIVMYRFKTAANFDAAFATIQDVPRRGFRSLTVVDEGFVDNRYKGNVRFLFNPVDFLITDTSPFFIRMATQPLAGVFGADGAIHMIVPYDPTPDPPVVLNGDAPNAASLATSLEINLPRLCKQFIFENLGGVDLYIALNRGGPEYRVTPTNILELFQTTTAVLFVRGAGGACTFNAVCTALNAEI